MSKWIKIAAELPPQNKRFIAIVRPVFLTENGVDSDSYVGIADKSRIIPSGFKKFYPEDAYNFSPFNVNVGERIMVVSTSILAWQPLPEIPEEFK